jgi:hypothetical protein
MDDVRGLLFREYLTDWEVHDEGLNGYLIVAFRRRQRESGAVIFLISSAYSSTSRNIDTCAFPIPNCLTFT